MQDVYAVKQYQAMQQLQKEMKDMQIRVAVLEAQMNVTPAGQAQSVSSPAETISANEVSLIFDPNIVRESSMRQVAVQLKKRLQAINIVERKPTEAAAVRPLARIYILQVLERWVTDVDVPSFVPLAQQQSTIPFFLITLRVGSVNLGKQSQLGNARIPDLQYEIVDVSGNVRNGIYQMNDSESNTRQLNNLIEFLEE